MSHLGTGVVLLLADGRFPGGGYAHAGGLEAAVADGSVRDLEGLRVYVEGRLSTVGALEAWGASTAATLATERGPACPVLSSVDRKIEARTWSPALRLASRSLGRGLRRAAGQVWPDARSIPAEHHPVVLGAVAAVAGLCALDAARLALHHHLMAPVSAAPKLMAVDTADALAVAAALAPRCDVLAIEASLVNAAPPAWTAPLCDARAEDHATWEVRLFAS